MKVAAIVPALNEEKNVGSVLKTLLSSKEVDEVILLDDGSTDRTSQIGRELGARVISLPKKGGSGKGNAMKEAVNRTDADIVAFFDADLIGLSAEHVSSLILPVLENRSVMCIGARQRWGGLPGFFIKLDPLLAIGGERAMKRFVFDNMPVRFLKGFEVETALNYYCLIKKLKVSYAVLKGLDIVVKEKKWGLYRGLKSRIRMVWQLIKVRFLIRFYKKEFKDV